MTSRYGCRNASIARLSFAASACSSAGSTRSGPRSRALVLHATRLAAPALAREVDQDPREPALVVLDLARPRASPGDPRLLQQVVGSERILRESTRETPQVLVEELARVVIRGIERLHEPSIGGMACDGSRAKHTATRSCRATGDDSGSGASSAEPDACRTRPDAAISAAPRRTGRTDRTSERRMRA